MRQRSLVEIWTITGSVFFHLWAVLEVVHLAPPLVRLVQGVTQGDVPLSSGFALFKEMPADVGLMVIGVVLVSDAWAFAAGGRLFEARQYKPDETASRANDISEFRWRKAGIALMLAALMVTVIFSVTGTARLLLTSVLFALVTAISVLLMWLRVNANSRVLDALAATEHNLRSADEHLREIEAYAKRNVSTT